MQQINQAVLTVGLVFGLGRVFVCAVVESGKPLACCAADTFVACRHGSGISCDLFRKSQQQGGRVLAVETDRA